LSEHGGCKDPFARRGEAEAFDLAHGSGWLIRITIRRMFSPGTVLRIGPAAIREVQNEGRVRRRYRHRVKRWLRAMQEPQTKRTGWAVDRHRKLVEITRQGIDRQ
jgi:hypothetical protein